MPCLRFVFQFANKFLEWSGGFSRPHSEGQEIENIFGEFGILLELRDELRKPCFIEFGKFCH